MVLNKNIYKKSKNKWFSNDNLLQFKSTELKGKEKKTLRDFEANRRIVIRFEVNRF